MSYQKGRVATTACMVLGILASGFIIQGSALANANPLQDNDAHEASAANYATTFGVSTGVASQVLADQAAVNTYLNDASDQVIEWTFSHSRDGQTLLARSRDRTLLEGIKALALSPFTRVELVNQSPTALLNSAVSSTEVGALVAAVPAIQGTYVDPLTGAFVVQVYGDLSDVAAQTIRTQLAKVPIRIEHLESPSKDSAIVRGGTAESGCTSAYTATYGSYIGVLTAAHCGGQQLYTGPTGGTAMAGTVRAQAYDADGDIEFLSVASSNSLYTTFYGPSATTPTQNKAQMGVGNGTFVCHRGMTTGQACGTVTSNAYRPTYGGACPNTTCNAVFVSVNADQAGGDSGGPWWFDNGNVLGVHKGGNSSNLSIYSKMVRRPSGSEINYP